MASANSTRNGRGIPAVTYVRMSSDKQDASPDQQRAELAKLAERGGYRITKEYFDDAISGDRTDKRHDFQRMIRDAERGDFKAILCWDQDRFGRFDSVEAGFYIHPLRQRGVSLVTVAQGAIDWNDFAGRLVYTVQQEAKHQFLRDLSRNMLRGRATAARRGEWLSPAPLGYRTENKRLVVGDADAVKLVRRMFSEYLAGRSLRAIAVGLNADGHKTRRGADWDGANVKIILSNVAYVGTFRWGDKQLGKYNQFDDDAIIIENNHPAIIDRPTFDEVQRRLPRRKRRTTPHQDGGGFVFTGMLRCGKCDSPMYGARDTGTVRYRCHGLTKRGTCDLNAAGQVELLDAVLDAIERRFNEPKTVQRLRDILGRKVRQQSKPASVDGLKRRLAKLDRDLSTARRNMALADGDDLRREYESVVRELRAERDRLNASILDAQKPPGRSASEQDQRITRAIQTLQRLRATLKRADTAKQRELLSMCVERIEVWSARSGGRGSTFKLERGVVHLRSDMWLADPEADNLCSTTRSTSQLMRLLTIPFTVAAAA